ncbi:lipopolysaccharide biosynthesis protein [Micromonospora sp. RP3T]|uniref:lipopolysaccharide biosynthesis protein n=1 Tax=Micromonospora sp. RP3T TaxID=2135446 RepID=UPI000D15BA35|nr:oligosaccharide flippase family protein [Micromonospora sp. RP3T]PTA46280.1 hypothetical protein C8054_11225 [Micromonospora sp. RP3T]
MTLRARSDPPAEQTTAVPERPVARLRAALRRGQGSGYRATVVSLTGSSLVRTASFALTGVLASRLLGPHDRGLMVLGTTTASLAGLLGGLGTGSALRARLPATPAGWPRRRLLSSYTWCSLGATALSAVIAVLASLMCALLIDRSLAAPSFLVALVVVTVAYTAMTQFPDVWYAVGEFHAGSGWAAGMATGGLATMLAAAAVDRRAWVLLLAQGVGMSLVAAAQTVWLRRAGLLPWHRPGPAEFAMLVRSGVRALALTLGLTLALRTDRYILGAFTGVQTVGVYSVAVTLSETPRLIPASLGQIVYREVALGGGVHRAGRVRRLALLCSVVSGVLLAVAGWLLVVPVFGAEFADARELLLILIIAEVCLAPFEVANRGLLGGGWMNHAGLLGAGGSALAVVLYVVTIPQWGAAGAAGASVLLYAALSATSWSLFRRRLAGRRAATEAGGVTGRHRPERVGGAARATHP